VTTLTAAIALAIPLGAVGIATGVVTGGSGDSLKLTPAADYYFPGPLMTLSAGLSGGEVTLTDSALRQTFTGGQYCEIVAGPGSDSLLTLEGSIGTGAVGNAGFRDGAIGVYEGTNASQCFRVDANSFTDSETLILSLGTDVSAFRASSATFDLMKQSGELALTATAYDGESEVGSVDLSSPKREKVGTRKSLTVSFAGRFFDSVHLEATLGSFSLTGNSTIQLAQEPDEQLCSSPEEGETDELTKDNASVTYLGDAGGTDSCFGVQLAAGPQEVRFLKPPTSPGDAQFVFDITWTLPNAGGMPGVTIPDADIDFEIGDTNITDMPFCSDFLDVKDDTGTAILTRVGDDLSIVNYGAFLDSAAFTDFDPGSTTVKEFACIDTRTSQVTADEINVYDLIFVIGDLKMTIR
jgi:hypothetical protein